MTENKARCHCCDKLVDFKPLRELENVGTQLIPGEETPVGACLECGALAYIADDYNRLDRASGVLQRDYLDDVKSLVESIKGEIQSRDITSMEQLHDRLHEDCDGNARVIYTHQAKLALVFSDNSDAYEEEMGGDMPNWSQLAFFAFHRDVQDRLDVDECPECGEALTFDGELCIPCDVVEDEEA